MPPWSPVRTAPSIAEAALGRIAQGTKVLAEGGHDRIFRQAFSAPPDEQLRKSYACYLSTAAGPVVGVLYLSTARVAFCSDGPLSYEAAAGGDGDGDRKEWSYYKVSRRSALFCMYSLVPRRFLLCWLIRRKACRWRSLCTG